MSRQPKRYANLRPFKGEDGQWYLRLRYGNGGIAMTSEGYPSKSKAKRAGRAMDDGVFWSIYEYGTLRRDKVQR